MGPPAGNTEAGYSPGLGGGARLPSQGAGGPGPAHTLVLNVWSLEL